MFSSGRASDALKYLERSMDLKNDNPSVYLYLGFCHEEMGKLYDARVYYEKAILMDPNDGNIKLSLDRINMKDSGRSGQMESQRIRKIRTRMNRVKIFLCL